MDCNYIKPETVLPNYFQFPDFLLGMDISQTAKLVYMMLYDRARLSLKNNRVINGCVYVNYTHKSMAEALEKSITTVKSAYKELIDIGLLKSTSGGFSKPNNLFVLLPAEGQNSDKVRKPATDNNLSVIQAENNTCIGQKTDLGTGGNPAPNKVNSNKYNNQNNIVRVNALKRRRYGTYENIYLTDEEYDSLHKLYPNKIESLIHDLSVYIVLNHPKHDDDYSALISYANGENPFYQG